MTKEDFERRISKIKSGSWNEEKVGFMQLQCELLFDIKEKLSSENKSPVKKKATKKKAKSE